MPFNIKITLGSSHKLQTTFITKNSRTMAGAHGVELSAIMRDARAAEDEIPVLDAEVRSLEAQLLSLRALREAQQQQVLEQSRLQEEARAAAAAAAAAVVVPEVARGGLEGAGMSPQKGSSSSSSSPS